MTTVFLYLITVNKSYIPGQPTSLPSWKGWLSFIVKSVQINVCFEKPSALCVPIRNKIYFATIARHLTMASLMLIITFSLYPHEPFQDFKLVEYHFSYN